MGVMLVSFGLLIGALDAWGGTVGRLLDMTAGRALAVGVAQALALMPGVSRAGVTIAAARGLGFDRPSAARFSFLLSAPVVLGAAALKLSDALRGDEAVQCGAATAGRGRGGGRRRVRDPGAARLPGGAHVAALRLV